MEEIVVSISCLTYNHEDYIAEAIEGFLMQKTDFSYEILIHDDASTDRTPEIIRKYELRYPDLIKPIYQMENQYSKGVKVGQFNRDRAKGKYIAICEGDDYWVDPYKLHKQVEALENNPKLAAVFHKVERVTTNKERTFTFFQVPIVKQDNIYSIKDIIRFDGGVIHVSSVLFKKEYFKNLPDFYYRSIVGDLPMALILATKGDYYYIDQVMSCYRGGVAEGAIQRLFKNSANLTNTLNNIIDIYNEFNRYTNYLYDVEIKEIIEYREFNIFRIDNNLKKMKSSNYYKKMNMQVKSKLYFSYYLPNTYKLLISFKKVLRKYIGRMVQV